MDKNLTVTATIDIDADNNQVWDALINPEKIKVYLFGTETISEWKVGSPIIFQGEFQGFKYQDKGMIKDIKPNKLIQYDYWSGFSGLEDKPENYSLVTYKLEYANNKTTLILTQTGFANELAYQHSLKAWTQILEKIKELTEKA